MKNTIKIVAFIFIAATSFTTILDSKSDSKSTLNSLFLVNNANAEVDEDGEVEDVLDCTYPNWTSVWPTELEGTLTDCPDGRGRCTPLDCGFF